MADVDNRLVPYDSMNDGLTPKAYNLVIRPKRFAQLDGLVMSVCQKVAPYFDNTIIAQPGLTESRLGLQSYTPIIVNEIPRKFWFSRKEYVMGLRLGQDSLDVYFDAIPEDARHEAIDILEEYTERHGIELKVQPQLKE